MDRNRAFAMLTGLVLATAICLFVLAGLAINKAHAAPVMEFAVADMSASVSR